MIRFEVVAYNGQPPLVDQACEFGAAGGNIGRADGNTMVLPDPERLISRVHASVTLRGSDFFIRDLSSSNPLIFNGTSLGNGREAILHSGDEISIGAYVLRVSVQGKERSAEQASDAPRAGSLLSGGDEPSSDNPFADLIQPPSANPPRASAEPAEALRATKAQPAATPAADGVRSFIPEDFDPFAAPPPATAGPGRLPEDLDLGIEGLTGKRSIDEMFDLRPSSSADPAPFPPTSASDTALGGVPIEPLEAIGASRAAPLQDAAQRDDAPEMFASFRMPQARIDPASDLARAPVVGPIPAAAPPKNDVTPRPLQSVPAAEVVRSTEPVPTPASTPNDELLREFLTGAGVPNVQITGGMTPRLMNMLGQLLRESTRGTLDLLRARALLKHEMRAAMTMMAENENNPLKFSPNVDAAMLHLLAPQGGYMTPLRAMKDAYDDLRAHEIAFMAGMRAALSGVLSRFNPEHLEPRLSESSLMDKILPVNRRAKRWEVFVALYEELSREAEDDFHTLFGKEFLRAYAAQIAQFEQGEKVPD